jgi:hypothetical protein
MKTSPQNNNCLNLKEMSLYLEGKASALETRRIENHLLDCLLCSDALEGFEENPHLLNEVPEQSGFSKGLKPTGSKLFLKWGIFVAGVLGLIWLGIALFPEPVPPGKTVAEKTDIPEKADNTSEPEIPVPTEKQVHIIRPDSEIKKIISRKAPEKMPLEKFGKEDPSIWMMPIKTLPEINSGLRGRPEQLKGVRKTFRDTFMYDLKISRYGELYRNDPKKIAEYFKGIDAKFENAEKKLLNNEENAFEYVTTSMVLEKAVQHFSKGNYPDALKLFNILAKHNEEDINALFYASVCYLQLNRAKDALVYLNFLTRLENHSFSEEAEWEKVNALIQLKEYKEAEKLLGKIVEENGFYAERANVLAKRVRQKLQNE